MPEGGKPAFVRMRSFQRESISEDFRVSESELIPEVPTSGARVKVCFAGACYTDGEVTRSGQRRLKSPGVHDTSLFPGYEVSGVIDEVCNTVASTSSFTKGDRVIVYPDNQQITHTKYAEYITVRNISNLLHIPDSVSLEVASLLPCGALTAYAAVSRAQPLVKHKLDSSDEMCRVMVVGAGGLGLWTLKMAEYFIKDANNRKRVHITVADTCVEKLMVAKEYGCFDVIHWSDAIHEEYILERTRDMCPGGVDVVIDFVSSPRTISRSLKLLKEEGALIVGGNTKYEMSFCLHTLAQNNQSIMGVNRGSRQQLHQLVHIFAQGKIEPPRYQVFPVDEANQVFAKLNKCQIYGRAVLRVSTTDDTDEQTDGPQTTARQMSTSSGESEVFENGDVCKAP